MVKLSIIIAYYKTYDLTLKLLKELSIQKTEDVEIVLIDDGCHENRFDIFKEFKIVHLEKNVGASSAWNKGLDNATGEYIGFIDSDDMITMDYIDVLLKTLKEHDEEIIYFNWADFNNNIIVKHPTNYALWKAIYKRSIFPRFVDGMNVHNDVPVQDKLRKGKFSEFYIDRVLYIYNSNRVGSITWKNTIKEDKMIKVEAIKQFTLKNFKEAKNIVRKDKNEEGKIFIGDVFECSPEIAEYLQGNNEGKQVVIKVLEVIPEIQETDTKELTEKKVELVEKPRVEKISKKKKRGK